MSAGSPAEVFGSYLVYEPLGVGGMAQVHRAEVTGIEGFRRAVALKRMLPHVASNRELVMSFLKEGRLASHLRHPNVPHTYELGLVDGVYFMAMELIQGYTLRELLQHAGATTGPMPVPIALAIVNQLCDALDYAHNCCDDSGTPLGIIHRDVSPSNVIVAEGGVVKLIDFGIAKANDDSMPTLHGTVKGKFGYMAPEYIAGQLDARADLFALGVIAHELLTNRPLFTTGDDMATLQRVQSMPIAPPSHTNPAVPAEIDDIVMTALARDPERRWQTASALRSAMTTLTRRLGMTVPSAKIVEWIQFAFAHPRPTHDPRRPQLGEGTASVHIVIEPGVPESPAAPAATPGALTMIASASPSGRISAEPSAGVVVHTASGGPGLVGGHHRREEIVPSAGMTIDQLATRARPVPGHSGATAMGATREAVPEPPAAAERGAGAAAAELPARAPSAWVTALLVLLLAAAVAAGVTLVVPLVI